jgi:hypothetical protein
MMVALDNYEKDNDASNRFSFYSLNGNGTNR